MRRNVMKIIDNCEKSGKIRVRYDIKICDIIKIRESCNNDYELITRSFDFGYVQGYKTAMAEIKK